MHQQQRSTLERALKSRGVLVSTDGPFNSIVKMKPPLCFGKFEANYLLKHLHQVLLKPYSLFQYICAQSSEIAQLICHLHNDIFRELVRSVPIAYLPFGAFILCLDEHAVAISLIPHHNTSGLITTFSVQRESFLRDTVSCSLIGHAYGFVVELHSLKFKPGERPGLPKIVCLQSEHSLHALEYAGTIMHVS